MRNLKKILALVLALVMALSVMSVAGAMKLDDYADSASVSSDYQTAVDVATQLGILNGMTATEYDPQGNLTRAQLATIIYRITTGDVTGRYVSNFVDGAAARFDDVTARHWAAGYIGYCADAGYLEGWDGKYWPEQAMTGYQALAALLRAIGYNEPGEFSGEAWTVRVAQLATQSGVSADVVANLNNPITREQTAQFIYNALWTEQVTYTPMFAYYSNTKAPLVEAVFKVDTDKGGVTGNSDAWGRPSTVWYAADGRTKIIEMVDDYVARYTVAVDECDIARDMGLQGDARIEKAFIDGDEYPVDSTLVTTDGEGNIGVYDTRSFVGAQGRITEVYDMGRDGVRIVEINTYLGVVTSVSAAGADKNDHPYPASITVGVYEDLDKADDRDWTFTVVAEGYSVGDYVLVHVNRPSAYATRGASVSASDVRLATVTTGGVLNGFTANTHVVGGTTYAEADKFELHYQDPGNWGVLLDDMGGNLIGLAPIATNYLVIEAISWIDSGIRGGYALADVVLSDGTKLENVTVANVNGLSAWNRDAQGVITTGAVSDGYIRNSEYYGHIWIYSVNADGSYNIECAPDGDDAVNIAHDDDGVIDGDSRIYDLGADTTTTVNGQTVVNPNPVTFAQGEATIADRINSFVATNATVYLVKGVDSYSYTVYVGKNNMPSGDADDVCVMTNTAGYATLVVADGFVPAANNMLVFITDWDWDNWGGSQLGRGYYVYPAGSASPITVYDPNGVMTTTGLSPVYEGTGLYEVSVDGRSIITAADRKVEGLDATADNAAALYTYGVTNVDHIRLQVEDELDNGSISTREYEDLVTAYNGLGYSATTPVSAAEIDFNVLEETTVLRVSKAGLTGDAVLTPSSASQIPDNAIVIVGYTDRLVNGQTLYNAQYVYWYVNDPYTRAAEYDFVLTEATMDIDDGAEMKIVLTENGIIMDELDIADLSGIDVTVLDAAGNEVYSTAPTITYDPLTGVITVRVRNTLTSGQLYRGIVTLTYNYTENGAPRQYTETLNTGLIEAQDQVGSTGTDADYEVVVDYESRVVEEILVYNNADDSEEALTNQIKKELESEGYTFVSADSATDNGVTTWTFVMTRNGITYRFTWISAGTGAVEPAPAATLLVSSNPSQVTGKATGMVKNEDGSADTTNLAKLKALGNGAYVFDYNVHSMLGVYPSVPEAVFYLNYTAGTNPIQYTIKDSDGDDVWDSNYGWTANDMRWTPTAAGSRTRCFYVGAWGYLGGTSAGDGTYTVTFTDTVATTVLAKLSVTVTGGKIVSITNA